MSACCPVRTKTNQEVKTCPTIGRRSWGIMENSDWIWSGLLTIESTHDPGFLWVCFTTATAIITLGFLWMRNSERDLCQEQHHRHEPVCGLLLHDHIGCTWKLSGTVASLVKRVLATRHARWLREQFFLVLNTKDGACCLFAMLLSKPQRKQNTLWPIRMQVVQDAKHFITVAK